MTVQDIADGIRKGTLNEVILTGTGKGKKLLKERLVKMSEIMADTYKTELPGEAAEIRKYLNIYKKIEDLDPDNVIVIFDEAYYEFLETPPDTLKYVREGRNVIVMRTFSKIQGLAGLRIGYGITTPNLASILQKTRQPFNANLLAQEAALAALADEDQQQRTKEITDQGRELFHNEFKAMGLEFVRSHANFVLLKVGDGDAVFKQMLNKGVIVRAMRSYKLPEWIRVSVGTNPENLRFLELLKSIIN